MFKLSATMALLMSAGMVQAATYYVSNSSGNDSNPSGTTAAPWKSLSFVSTTNKIVSGDTVYFKSGDTWEGTLTVRSGVTYGRWGTTGNAPKFKGSRNVSTLNWVAHSGNIYKVDLTSTVGSNKVVSVIDGTGRLTRARFPNAGSGEFNLGANRYLKAAAGTTGASTTSVLAYNTASIPTVGQSDLVGASVYFRNYDWHLTRYDVTGVSGNQVSMTPDLDWAYDKSNPVSEGMGYWLEGKLWMLDAAGEWHFDPSSKMLYVWSRNGATPKNTTISVAIDRNVVVANGASSFTVKDIDIDDSANDAVSINNAGTAFTLSNLRITRPGAMGIAVIGGSVNGSVTGNTVKDSVHEAIYTPAPNVNITNNTVQNAGIGFYAKSAVFVGDNGTVSGNFIHTSSMIGIHGSRANTISSNVVTDSCRQFDDCGAIYVNGIHFAGKDNGGVLSTSIQNNVVVGTTFANARDRRDGVGEGDPNSSSTRGIYLDDFASSVTVSGNYSAYHDYGVLLHYGRDNTISGNTVVGGSKAQIWMQENWTPDVEADVCNKQALCNTGDYLSGNQVNSNVFVSTNAVPLIKLNSDFGNTTDFATYSGNIYQYHGTMGKGVPVFALDKSNSGETRHSFSEWQSAVAGRDSASTLSATSRMLIDNGLITYVSNGSFDVDTTDWSSWHGQLVSTATGCASTDKCVQVTANTSGPDAASLDGDNRRVHVFNTTMPMSLSTSYRYVAIFDAKADVAGDWLDVVGVSNSNYVDLTKRATVFLGTQWQRYAYELPVIQTENNTARLEFDLHTTGSVRLDNVKLIQVVPFDGPSLPLGIANTTNATLTVPCPNASLSASDCGVNSKYKDPNGNKVSFPLNLAVRGYKTLRWYDADFVDSDQDSVPDYADSAPNTAAGKGVDDRGRAIGQ